MRRTMNAKTLNDYLRSAHTIVMLCRAHADTFSLSCEDISDVQLQIEIHIADLEILCAEMRKKNINPPIVENVVRLATVR